MIAFHNNGSTLAGSASGRRIIDTRDGATTFWRLNNDKYIATIDAFIELAELAGLIETAPVKGHYA